MRFRFGDHLLDAERRELRDGDGIVDVEPQVFDLLLYLLRNRTRVVGKPDLIAGLWGGRVVSDATIDSRVKSARQAIGDSGTAQRLIRTFPRKGIRFLGDVVEEVDVPLAATSLPELTGSTLLLPDKPSIAVLPFANLSSDQEQEFLADGFVEDVITTLSRYPSLFVIARHSCFTYKGRIVDVKEIGRELGVRYILEGSLRKSADRIRLTGQLIEAETGNHLWAGRYDRNLADIFAVQDEIAGIVAAAIAPAIDDNERRRALRRPPENLDAWAAYQRAHWHLGKWVAEEVPVAEELFRKAIKLDPRFAGGYSGLAWAQMHHCVVFQLRDTSEAVRNAEFLARQAVALDGTDADARACLAGALLLGHGDYEGAQREAASAIEISPNLAAAHGELGRVLIFGGQPRMGVASVQRSIRLDPRHPMLSLRLNQMAAGLYFARDYEGAIDAAKQAIRSYPDHPFPYRWLAAALGQVDRIVEGQEALKKAVIAPSFKTFVRAPVRWHRPEDYEHMLDGLRKAGWQAE